MVQFLINTFPRVFGFLDSFRNTPERSVGITYKELEQERKNREYVAQIIEGHYALPQDPQVRKLYCETANAAYKKWQEYQRNLFDTVAGKYLAMRRRLMQEKKFYEFFPDKISEEPPSGNEYEIFLKDAFTEPFPSLHDFPEWAIGTQMTDIMVLNGFDEEVARQSYLHKKGHYVNHKMTKAIIWFDVYLKK
jgi:hypothetical protein